MADGLVTTDELRRYVARTVSERTGGRQNPSVDRDNVTVSIALPVVRDSAALAVRTRDDPTPPSAGPPPAVRPPPVRPSACGCRAQGRGESGGGAILGGLALLALLVWRRRYARASSVGASARA